MASYKYQFENQIPNLIYFVLGIVWVQWVYFVIFVADYPDFKELCEAWYMIIWLIELIATHVGQSVSGRAYRKVSNIRRTIFQNISDSRTVLHVVFAQSIEAMY